MHGWCINLCRDKLHRNGLTRSPFEEKKEKKDEVIKTKNRRDWEGYESAKTRADSLLQKIENRRDDN